MKKCTILFLLIFIVKTPAQQDQELVYNVNLILSGGPSLNLFQKQRFLGAEDDVTPGFDITLRGMWHPGRLLAVGFLTGYVFFAKDDLKAFGEEEITAAKLRGIPLQAVVSMQSECFELGVGMGPYLMMSTIEFGGESNGRRLELGLTFIGAYKFRINDNICIGPELRVLYLSYRGIMSFMPSLNLLYEVCRY